VANESRMEILIHPSKFNVNDITSIPRKSSNPQLTRAAGRAVYAYMQASAHEIFDEIDEAQNGTRRLTADQGFIRLLFSRVATPIE